MTALIISGGDFAPAGGPARDLVIACDRGYLHALKMGIRPDLVIGDFDSVPAPDTDIPVERHPVRKDDTDTMLAVRRALEKGCDEIAIACAFGGRLDHTYANIQAGAYAAERGAVARLYGAETEACVFSGRTLDFPRRGGYSFSVFSVTDRSSATIAGAAYGCDKLEIRNTFPIGISNEWSADSITVAAHSGIVMVMESLISE